MVPRKVEEEAGIWAIERQLVRKFCHEWKLGDVPVFTVVAFVDAGNGHIKTMDRDGLEILVR